MQKFLSVFTWQKKDRANRYEREKNIATTGTVPQRLSLAKSRKTHPEILYFLAQNDPDAGVRQAVANNETMPVHVSPFLARDQSPDVRLALAARLVSLLPSISTDKQSQLYAFAVQALGTLALDEVLKIRLALSSTLKDHAYAPPKVAAELARDVERDVSEPILRFCAALSDRDLLDILKSHPASWVVQAIAGRSTVSKMVSAAVINVDDITGGKVLLRNRGADIALETLQKIVERARDYKDWQESVAVRPFLPFALAKELAEFVDAAVRDLLMQRPDFDGAMAEEISEVFRRRLDFIRGDSKKPETVEQRVKRMAKKGELTDEAITDALAVRETDFVYAALAHLAGVAEATLKDLFEARSAKPIVALCWKAGLSMRTALTLQRDLAQVPPKNLLYPKGGTDYPMTEEELEWQLDFLGVAKK
ncbi:MAG: DUF2336 domain-containing protein [Alphaproteobacteria bacterium]|nr:DUF2336 domain-containing protein [Alphaproteobacteria bacterium]QQS56878.1 MAG: DUF2336 domain-containing protein [Alphaproteobacteria bacterium]